MFSIIKCSVYLLGDVMNNPDQETLKYYGEQLSAIREINKDLGLDNTWLRRENGFLICLVISLVIWIATG